MQKNLEDARIPLVVDAPTLPYIVAVDSASDQVSMLDARLIRIYLEYICDSLYQRTFDEMVERWSGEAAPYAAVPGHRTVVLLMRSWRDWAYCRDGNMLYSPARNERPRSLRQVLDRVATHEGLLDGASWDAWKQREPWACLFEERPDRGRRPLRRS